MVRAISGFRNWIARKNGRNLTSGDAIFSLRAWERRESAQPRRAIPPRGSRTRTEFPRASFSLFRPTKSAPARISLCRYPTLASRSSKAANRPRDNAPPRACPQMLHIVPFCPSRPNKGPQPSRRLRSIYESINKSAFDINGVCERQPWRSAAQDRRRLIPN